jgi:hypothetical protein
MAEGLEIAESGVRFRLAKMTKEIKRKEFIQKSDDVAGKHANTKPRPTAAGAQRTEQGLC